MIKVWGRPNSIHTQRVLWACHEATLNYELILASATMGPKGHISGGGRAYGIVETQQYREMNPNGTIPTIDDDGYILWESNTISRYIAQAYAPDALYGNNFKTLGLGSQWMDLANTQLEPALHILVMELARIPHQNRNQKNIENARRQIIPVLQCIDRHLAKNKYVAGDQFSVGDIAPGCAVYRWGLFNLERPDMPNLKEWQAWLLDRPGFQNYVAPREHHLA